MDQYDFKVCGSGKYEVGLEWRVFSFLLNFKRN